LRSAQPYAFVAEPSDYLRKLSPISAGSVFSEIQKYENGANRISFSRLVQIAKALRCRVVDLMDVLDAPGAEAQGEVDVLSRMRTPGALELLAAFEQLPQDSRSSLIGFMRSLTPMEHNAKS